MRIDVCDYLLIIFAELGTGLHSISNLSREGLFNGADIRALYNQATVSVVVPETGSVGQLSLWENFSGQQCS